MTPDPIKAPEINRGSAKSDMNERKNGSIKPTPSSDVAIGTVIDWFAGFPGKLHSDQGLFSHLKIIFDGLSVSFLIQDNINKLVEHRWVSPVSGRLIEASTAKQVLRRLMHWVRKYCEAYNMIPPVVQLSANPRQQRERVVERDELARIYMACLGWRWDHEAGKMRKLSGSSFTRTRKRRAPVRRLIAIMYGSGSDPKCACNLRWHPDPKGMRSYVDLQGGWLHRLGRDAGPEKLRTEVKLTKYLWRKLNRWFDKADPMNDLVIPDQTKHISEMHSIFRAICKDAGVEGVTLSVLSFSFGAMVLKGDGTIRGLGVSLGTRGATIHANFGELARNYQANAIEALRKKPASIR